MSKSLLIIGVMFALAGCAGRPGVNSPQQLTPDLPYRTWEIGLLAPNYMEAWVESVDVLDRQGHAYVRVHGGLPSIQNPPEGRGNPAGWPLRPGSGATRPMTGIDLPEIVFVRWQSLVEPQTYRVRIDIPHELRQEMLTQYSAVCRFDGVAIEDYRKVVTIGLAPGGIAKAWLSGDCLEPVEIGRFEGSIHPEGPYEGTSGGKHRPLSPEAQAYIEKHEIPFNSW